MSVADSVLDFLEKNRDRYISGEETAAYLGVSRNAVWKAVKALRQKGYDISAVTNKGYVLSHSNRIISAQGIEKHIKCGGIRVEHRDIVTSTNTVLKEMAENGEKEGLLLAASEQTAGKGRRGRSFSSNKGTGVYFSLLLRPDMNPSDALLITTCAAVAVARAVELNTGKNAQIKWVNDVYMNGRKICGILTEASFDIESGKLAYAVLGIGINIYFPENSLSEELVGIAGAVFDNDNFDGETVNKIIADTVNIFMDEYKNLTDKNYIDDYRKRSYLDGKKIYVIKSDGNREAEALGIDDNFRLHVKYSDGSEEYLSSGEVSTKVKAISHN